MSALKTYIFLLFGITAVLYLFGFTSPFISLLSNVGVSETGASVNYVNMLLNSMANVFLNPAFLGLLGFASVAAYLGGGGSLNFGVYYLVPIFILMALMNYFVLPTDLINTMSFSPIIGLLTIGFLNLLMAMSIIEFIRGG